MAPKEPKVINLAKNRFTRQFRLRCGTLKICVVKKNFFASFFRGHKATFVKWTVKIVSNIPPLHIEYDFLKEDHKNNFNTNN